MPLLSRLGFLGRMALAPLAILGGSVSALAMPMIDVIAINGDAAPGGNGTYNVFTHPPILNDSGELVFRATLSGTSGGSADDFGVFAADGSIAEVAREGSALPDGNGSFAQIPFDPAQNPSGQVVFRSRLSGTALGAADDDAVYRWDGGTPVRIGREGDAAPGGGAYLSFSLPAINDSGVVGWTSALTVGGGAVFRGDGTSAVEIARSGDPAPSGGGDLFSLSSPTINASGQVAFASTILNAPVGQGGSGLFLGDGSSLVALAREDDLTGNGTFGQFSIGRPALNDSGQIAFYASLNATSGGSADDRALFRTDGTTLVEVMREGDASPDGDGNFTSFSTFVPVLNNSGQVAFLPGFTNSTSLAGVGFFDGATLQNIVRTGDAIPTGNGEFQSFFDVSLNDGGQVSFRSNLRNTSGGTSDDSGLFLSDPAMGILTVVREGDLLLGSAVTSLTLADSDEESSGLNDQDELAFGFELADGRRGVAVWSLPEPTLGALLTCGVLGMVAGARGKRRGHGAAESAGR